MFRCFDIIAAAAYAAENKAREYDHDDPLGPPWDELNDAEKHVQIQCVMAIKRGEDVPGSVFVATAKAILDFNNGQGGLALEELTALGAVPFDLELVKEADVAGRNIRDVIADLLNELAERREGGASVRYSARFYALKFAIDQFPQHWGAASAEFLGFLRDEQGLTTDAKINLLSLACQAVKTDGRPSEAVPSEALDLAIAFEQFVTPPTPAVSEAQAELEDATVQ